MIGRSLRWAFHSRRRFLGCLGLLLGVLVLNAVAQSSLGRGHDPSATVAAEDPATLPTDPGEWLQPTATPSPSRSTRPPVAVTETSRALSVAESFTGSFLDATVPPARWREELAKDSTPELTRAFQAADPARVPTLTGRGRFKAGAVGDGQATVMAAYTEGTLRLTLTSDGIRWRVANVVPVRW